MFGPSPFAPLKSHMDKVAACVEALPELFRALKRGDSQELDVVAKRISKLEHEADLTKNDIRNHLPKSIFLPIDRGQLLEILQLQDQIADCVEDISVLLTLKKLVVLPEFENEFDRLYEKNREAFEAMRAITDEMHELLETSFGGFEAERVRDMVEKVAYLEHEGDLVQRDLLSKFFALEERLTSSDVYLWLKIFQLISQLSNLSEKLANRIRMTLDLK